MMSFIRSLFLPRARCGNPPGATPARSTSAQPQSRPLTCEPLEDRLLLSLSGLPTLANTKTTGWQLEAATASSASGRAIVVWVDTKQYGWGDIRGQLYDAGGRKTGGELLLVRSTDVLHTPAVAMNSKGGFALAWVDDWSPSDHDVMAVAFTAAGVQKGNAVSVSHSPRNEYNPSVGIADSGDYVVSYTYDFSSTDPDIYARMFSATGAFQKTIPVAVGTRPETHSSVARAADGRFAVAFTFDGSIRLARYNAQGGSLGTAVVSAGKPADFANLAVNAAGDYLAAFQENAGNNRFDVKARRVSAAGVLSSVYIVAATTASETRPKTAFDFGTSRFVTVYESTIGTTTSVKITESSDLGVPVATYIVGVGLARPDVTVLFGHAYLVASQSLGARLNDPDGGILVQVGRL
jgi:hypothetical protein